MADDLIPSSRDTHWPIVAPREDSDRRSFPQRTPSFSVIIPTYESADCVAEATSSALNQSPAPIEVIVVDDGSTDDPTAALSSVRDRITIVRQPNRGLSAAKNAGLVRASGEFVTILDADDVFLPRRLEALTYLAELRPDLDILTTDAYVTSAGKHIRRFYSTVHRFAADDQEIEILKRCFLLGNAAVRRELLLEIEGFDESLRRAGDWDCWIRLFRCGAKAGLVESPLVEYRQTPGSLTSNRVESLRARVIVLEKTLSQTDRDSRAYPIVQAALRKVRERLRREAAKTAILSGRNARRESAAVVFGPSASFTVRVRAFVAVVAPGLAGRRLRRR
jgi:glycosyltransferase involved in cell wall biosynthesis